MALRFRGGEYRPNSGLTGVAGIAVSAPMRAALKRVVEEGQRYAEGIAPVESGDYLRAFDTDVRTRGEGRRRRAEGVLVNTMRYASALEFGTSRARGRHVLGRTIDFLESR